MEVETTHSNKTENQQKEVDLYLDLDQTLLNMKSKHKKVWALNPFRTFLDLSPLVLTLGPTWKGN
jgi:hypothetical protein